MQWPGIRANVWRRYHVSSGSQSELLVSGDTLQPRKHDKATLKRCASRVDVLVDFVRCLAPPGSLMCTCSTNQLLHVPSITSIL